MKRLFHNLTTTCTYVSPVGDKWIVINLNIWQAVSFDYSMYGWRVAAYNFWYTLTS